MSTLDEKLRALLLECWFNNYAGQDRADEKAEVPFGELEALVADAAKLAASDALERAAQAIDKMATYEDPGHWCYAKCPADVVLALKSSTTPKPEGG